MFRSRFGPLTLRLAMINFTSALELLRSVRGTARELDNDQISQGLLDLQGLLLMLQVQVLEQQVEARNLQSEATRLRSCLTTARKLERVHDSYFVVNNEADVRGPYCVSCWDRRDVLQALVDANDNAGYCPNCKSKVKTGTPRRGVLPLRRAVGE